MMKVFKPSSYPRIITNERGQSTAEYIIIVMLMFTAFLGKDAAIEQLQLTFHNKYKSYAFGVSISDPPSKSFDDTVKKTADKIKNIIDSIKNIIDIIAQVLDGKIDPGREPGTEILEQFKHIIEQFKH